MIINSQFNNTQRNVLKCNGPVPVAGRSKAYVCCRSRAEIVDSNPTRGAWMFVVCVVCFQVEVSVTG